MLCKSGRVGAVIVSAGSSSRMGEFKPLLEISEGETIIGRCIRTLRKGGVKNIVVVTGRDSNMLEEHLRDGYISFVCNPDYASTDMYYSAKLGFTKLLESGTEDKPEQVFFLPGDSPLFTADTLLRMLEVMYSSKAGIVVPMHNGRTGHPLLINTNTIPKLLGYEGDMGLKGAMSEYRGIIEQVELPDIGINLDIDTPRDLHLARLLVQPMEERLSAHCKAVASMALVLSERLNERGYSLDLQKIELAALLHDMWRGEKNHAKTGGDELINAGQPELSEIVRQHMHPDPGEEQRISEITVVYLADKLLKEDIPVKLEERYKSKVKRYAQDPHIRDQVQARLETAKRVRVIFEAAMGCTLEEIIKEEYIKKLGNKAD